MEEFIQDWGVFIAFLGLLGIEISPIKISPLKLIGKLLKWLMRLIGRLLHSDLIDRIDLLTTKVNKLERDADFKDLVDIKSSLSNYHVLLATTGLDENQYRRCFEMEQRYRKYKEKYPGEVNGHMDALLDTIHHNYKKGNILKVDLQNK